MNCSSRAAGREVTDRERRVQPTVADPHGLCHYWQGRRNICCLSASNIVSAPHSQNQKAGNRVWEDAVPRLPAAEPAGKA